MNIKVGDKKRLRSREDMDALGARFVGRGVFIERNLGKVVRIVGVQKCISRTVESCRYVNECESTMTIIDGDDIGGGINCCGVRLVDAYNWKKL